jgi:hypothetical protein
VPTPFYHIAIAGDLLINKDLYSNIRERAIQDQGAFLFGHTAPDVQVVSGARREETHFFTLPLSRNAAPAWELFLSNFPEFQVPEAMHPDQAAFIAGYLCHLQGDWFWIRDIYAPVFGPDCTWSSFPHRLYLHNVLRAYLDQKVIDSLPGDTDQTLSDIRPYHWLPFVEDIHLIEWRDFIAEQLKPGSVTKTVEVFSERQGIEPEDFHRLMESEIDMEREVFIHFPRTYLEEFRQMLVEENIRLLNTYWHSAA